MDTNNDDINLDVLPKESERVFKELSDGNLVIARSKNDFIYIVAFDEQFHIFMHTPGQESGAQKQYPVGEEAFAVVRSVIELADVVYMAVFDKSLNLYGVMYTAEEGILEMFPGDDRDSDGMVDFSPPDNEPKPGQ